MTTNAVKRKQGTDAAIEAHNAKGQSQIFRLPDDVRLPSKAPSAFSCAHCTVSSQKFTTLRDHKCAGSKNRDKIMQGYTRRKFWRKLRQHKPEAVGCYVAKWKLKQSEIQMLEEGLSYAGGRSGIPPATNCSWYHDLCQDGDVEPNPGPSGGSCYLEAIMINAQGAANTWAVARWVQAHRPALAVVQEVAMNEAKQALESSSGSTSTPASGSIS